MLSPQGLYDAIVEASDLGVPLFITETGVADKTDRFRGTFIRSHYNAVSAVPSAECAGFRWYFEPQRPSHGAPAVTKGEPPVGVSSMIDHYGQTVLQQLMGSLSCGSRHDSERILKVWEHLSSLGSPRACQ